VQAPAAESAADLIQRLRAQVKLLQQGNRRKTRVIQRQVNLKQKSSKMVGKLRMRNTNLQSRVSLLQVALKEAQSQNTLTKKSRSTNAHRAILSIHGTYRIAVKRNQGHAGQLALVHMLEQNINRWAVTRAEMLLSTFFNDASKNWCSGKYAQLHEVLHSATEQQEPGRSNI
jgi:hypothetical protein